jgi:carboxymethylenebutenolidase
LSGLGPQGGRTDSFPSADAATQALYKLDPVKVSADLDATAKHALALPACDGRLFVAGFCWGGSQAFRYATERKDLKAAFVFYGSAPTDEEALARIACPVHGFYGESDARINATLPATGEAMKKLGLTFDPVVYAGAGHGFLRAGEASDASEANKKARVDAWTRWKKLMGV